MKAVDNAKHQYIVGPCRLSYLNVFAPRMNEQRNEMEYSVQLLFPKKANDFAPNAEAEIKALAEAIKATFAERYPKIQKWEAPLKDGDKETNTEGEPKAPGHFYMSIRAKSEYPPVLIDGDKETATSGWVSGDWGKVKISLYGYEHSGKFGVGAGLRAIQFLRKDEPLGSANDPETVKSEFDEEKGDKPVAAQSVPNIDEYDPFADE